MSRRGKAMRYMTVGFLHPNARRNQSSDSLKLIKANRYLDAWRPLTPPSPRQRVASAGRGSETLSMLPGAHRLGRALPLPVLHPNSGLPEFGTLGGPKSDTSDFG